MKSIYNEKPYVFVFPEESRQAADRQIELNSIHAWEDKQILQNLLNKLVLVICDLSLRRVAAKSLAQIILVVNMADFLVELSS